MVPTATVMATGPFGTAHAFGGESLAVTTACVSVSVFHDYRYKSRYIVSQDISGYIFFLPASWGPAQADAPGPILCRGRKETSLSVRFDCHSDHDAACQKVTSEIVQETSGISNGFLVKIFAKSFKERRLFKKGGTQKLLLFFTNVLFPNNPQPTRVF
ncbi:hypothetical protein [Novacetimonas pomaceti]|uniref:hypothetical protein n=1 Tax=Novacetimonas pomaceti TaxID=2021998 RepID=UPI0014023D8F|nr:hypothetical protein [Novacetimonas pomaceti]